MGQVMRVAVVVPSFADRDAVGRDVAEMAAALNERGTPARVLADRITAVEHQAYPLGQMLGQLDPARDVIVYHHCTYWRQLAEVLAQPVAARVIRFHDVTPPEFYRSVSDLQANSAAAARRQTKQCLAAGNDLLLATSEFTRQALIDVGADAERCRTLPPLHVTDRLRSVEPDPTVLRRFDDGRVNLLCVGRLAPNKNHLALIEALAELDRRRPGNVRLILVGPRVAGAEGWVDQIRQVAARLGVGDALVLAGSVNDAELAACYRVAHVYVSASLHEGFGVPLVEAMAMGTPIVALAAAAVPETVDNAGLLVDPLDRRGLAEAIFEVCQSEALRRELIAAGAARYAERFHPRVLAERFYNLLKPFDRNATSASPGASWLNGQALSVENAAEQAEEFIGTIPEYGGAYDGRGIVICAGGIQYSTCAWVLVNVLRAVGCRLPIQVWYGGGDELDEGWQRLVEPLGVECVDAHQVANGAALRPAGWALKPFALLHCPFREVLLLDADNVPVRDPSCLFDEPAYRTHGAIFWPDGRHTPADSPRWRLFGVAYRDEPELESGQLLIDKQRCWKPLNLCQWYNERSDFFYQYVYGDKDTFLFAWRKLETPFAMPEKPLKMLRRTLCQHDMQGDVLFQHRSQDKWSLAGNERVPGFVHERLCFELMDELRRCWQPLDYLARRHPRDSREMQAMVGRRFQYVRVGHVRWPIALGVGGLLLEGWSTELLYWWAGDGCLFLAASHGKRIDRFEPAPDGGWIGRADHEKNVELRLVPIDEGARHDRAMLAAVAPMQANHY